MDTVYYRVIYDESGAASIIYILVIDCFEYINCYKIDGNSRIDCNYTMEDWLSINVSYRVPVIVKEKELIAYFNILASENREKETIAEYEPGKTIRFKAIDKKTKKKKISEYQRLCTGSEFFKINTPQEFFDFLSKRNPAVIIAVTEEQKDNFRNSSFFYHQETLDDILDYDIAKDPRENPWIDILGDDDEAEQAYWNTQ